MNNTYEKLINSRVSILDEMDTLIRETLDKDSYYLKLWQSECFPENVKNELFEEFATNNEIFKDCVNTFNFIISKIF